MKVKEIRKALKLRQRKLPELSLRLGYLIRPLIILVTSLIIAGIYYLGEEIPSLTEGDIALRDVYAPFDFEYKVGTDLKKTKELREKARIQAGEVYLRKSKLDVEIVEKLKKIFSLISQADESQPALIPEELLKLLPQGTDIQEVLSLGRYNQEKILSEVSQVLREFYRDNYVMVDSLLDNILNLDMEYIYLKEEGGISQLPTESLSLVSLSQAKEMLASDLNRRLKLRGKDVLVKIVLWNLAPNLEFLAEETEELKREAASRIGDVYFYKEVKKHEKILSKGQRIKKEDLIKLREISRRYGNRKLPATLGVFFFCLLFLALVTLSYKYFNLRFYQDVSKLVLVSLVTILIVGITKIIVVSPLPSQLIPVAMGSILIAMLLSFPIAMKLTIFVAAISGLFIGENLVAPFTFLVGGIAAAMLVKDVRKRSHLLKAGILVGGVQFFTVVFLGLFFAIDLDVFLKEGVNSFAGGVFSAFLALGLLPILEHIFKITTNIRLLELSDLNHPLLKQLLIKAPGTYHHSLIVSSLAEQAAEAVRANPLLARVGAYFHDIGKLDKPEYFTENQPPKMKERSRHDKLSPSMSSLVIINHTKKGLELAQKYKLPPAIVDFIEQHHGTSLVYYFYHKALEIGSEEEIKEEQFRYPGPKPQTKEVAIVSLADAVEAASRSLQEPTPARIKGLIKEIINSKFAAGELDECELTLKDLNKIAEVFTRLSLSIHHVRVEYPVEKKS